MKEKEIWKPFPEFEKRYEVSNFGRYRSLRHTYVGSQLKIIYKILAFGFSPKFNYLYASVRVGGKQNYTGIHIVVAKVFVPNDSPEERIFVNHKDGDRYNNHYSNLEWCTASENQKHAYDTGLRKPPVGQKNGRAILTDDEVIQIFRSDENHYFLAAMYGVDRSVIGRVKNGRAWSHLTGKEYTYTEKQKLSDEDIMSILNEPGDQRVIAKKYGISQSAVSAIKTGRSYSAVTNVVFNGRREYEYYGIKNKV